MFSDTSDPRTSSKHDKKKVEEDLCLISVVSSTVDGYDGKALATFYFGENKSSTNFKNGTHSKCSQKDLPNDATLHSNRNAKFASRMSVFREYILPTVISLGRKTTQESEYFELQKQSFRFIENIFNENLSNIPRMKLFQELLADKIMYNFTKTLNYESSNLNQDNSKIQCFNQIFSSSIQRIIHWDITEVLRNETILNIHLACRRHPRNIRKSKQHNIRNLICNISSIDSTVRPSVPTLAILSGECGIERHLTMLCIFTKNLDFVDNTLNHNQSWTNEDIKMVLPMTWNIEVACNVVTVTDECNKTLKILFRNPLNVKIDYKHSTVSSHNTISNKDIVEATNILKSTNNVQNKQMRDMKLPNNNFFFTTKNKRSSISPIENKHICKSTNAKNLVAIDKTDPIPLQEPLLLKYADGKKTKQILMYKDHSVRNFSDKSGSQQFCKTIENLLTRSVCYAGDPVHLIFDPLKAIHQLKRGRKIGGALVHVHSLEPKRDLIVKHSDSKTFRNRFGGLNLCKAINDNNALITTGNIWNVAHTTEEKRRSKTSDNSTSPNNTKSFQKSIPVLQNRISVSVINNEKLTMHERNRENKLKQKTCRRKKSITAFKRVNVKKIVSSVFRHFFHFYSLIGGHLRSGSVITKSNSNYWLKVSGVATDSYTLRLAGDMFTAIAGTKVVLNIYDYLKFLIAFARKKRIIVAELVKQMTVCEKATQDSTIKKHWNNQATLMKHQPNVFTNDKRDSCLKRIQSLPDLRNI